MREKPLEPLLWTLFSAGGVVAAFLIPVHLFLFGIAFPLGWMRAPAYVRMLMITGSPFVRLYLIVLCALPLVHWAHRFRYTLYDGLQIKHLDELINLLCYGGAMAGSVLAVYFVLKIP